MKGSCLCGSVSFETNEIISEVTACHCGMCNTWSSSPFIAIQLKEPFIVSGDNNISHYKSSEWAERTFCKKCGTLLYYKSSTPEFYHFNAALFHLSQKINSISIEIFTDKKPDYYNFLSFDSRKMTENDVFEFIKSQTD
jgi:hypothetical protein